jgi:hypothetical protein
MVTSVLADIGALGTFFGVVFAGVQLVYSRHQARTTFEDGVTSLYRKLASELPVEVFFNSTVAPEIVKAHRAVFYRYFDLCNEQAFLFEQERVSSETWEQWRDGMKGNMGRSAFKQAWYQEIQPYVGDDFQEFKRVLAGLQPLGETASDRLDDVAH